MAFAEALRVAIDSDATTAPQGPTDDEEDVTERVRPRARVRRQRLSQAPTPQGPAEEVDITTRSTLSAEGRYVAENVDELLAEGRALMGQRKYSEAIPFFERASQRDPTRLAIWTNLGFAYNELGRPQDGLAAYDRALALDDRRSWLWGNKGAVLSDLKRYNEALVATNRALTLDPDVADFWFNRGIVLMNVRRYTEAVTSYQRALDLDPADAPAWRFKGTALNELRRYEEAFEAYDQALELDPEHVSGWSGLATALRGLGRVAEAKQAERRVHQLLKGNLRISPMSTTRNAGDPVHVAYTRSIRRSFLLWIGIAVAVGLAVFTLSFLVTFIIEAPWPPLR
jgi:tetratricopeptide (TPR) repeat protein